MIAFIDSLSIVSKLMLLRALFFAGVFIGALNIGLVTAVGVIFMFHLTGMAVSITTAVIMMANVAIACCGGNAFIKGFRSLAYTRGYESGVMNTTAELEARDHRTAV